MNVRIYKPAKTAMQSGRAKTERWILEYEVDGCRAPEALMGWTSAGDTLNQVRMQFDTAEDAVAHAERQGWGYSVEPVRERRVKPRNYSDKFKYMPADE